MLFHRFRTDRAEKKSDVGHLGTIIAPKHPAGSGIELFNSGKPVSGDITSKIILWDAGTEVNLEPGIGPDQGPRQKAPNTGEAENSVVRNAKDVKYGSAYMNVSSVMRVTIKPAQVPGAN